MKAVWYEEVGPAREVLRFGEQPTPEPEPGEVRIRLKASGVNPSDVKARAGARGPLAFDLVIPHSDGAGVIDAVGQGVCEGRIGERVWTWNAAWRRAHGTCADYVCLPEVQAAPLPNGVDFDAGACLGVPAMTACHAVFADGPVVGKTVLVTGGAGAVGYYAVQFAKWGGAKVIATVSSREKAVYAWSAGADHVVDYQKEDVSLAIESVTGRNEIDRIVEVEFGGNLAVTSQIIATGGVIVAYGSMANPTPSLPFYPLMFKNVTLRLPLIYLLSPSERQETCRKIVDALEQGVLKHEIAARFPLGRTDEAHMAVEAGASIGNVVVTID